MGEFKHLVIVKFKKGVDVEEIMKGMEELVSGINLVKSFERHGERHTEGQEMRTQGFANILQFEAPRVVAQVLFSD